MSDSIKTNNGSKNVIKLECDFENSFGIKKLKKTFEFFKDDKKPKAIAIYAKNGLMKTSFAKIFKKYQEGNEKEIKDLIFENSKEKVDIKILDEESGLSLDNKNIFVIESLNEIYESKNIKNLLIRDKLKEDFNEFIDSGKDFLSKIYKLYNNIEKDKLNNEKISNLLDLICEDFQIKVTHDGTIYSIINEINEIINSDNEEIEYEQLNFLPSYYEIFNPNNESVVNDDKFQKHLEKFIDFINQSLKTESSFSKGGLNLAKLTSISDALNKNSFFESERYIWFSDEKIFNNINSMKEWIESLKKKILDNKEFENIQKKLSSEKGKKISELLEKNIFLIQYMHKNKQKTLKRALWKKYFTEHKDELYLLQEKYLNYKERIEKENFSDNEWEKAVQIFENRFFMPFKMKISNLHAASIGTDVPKVSFVFKNDKDEEVIKSREEINELKTLSQGEKRALYLLNIILEIENLKIENSTNSKKENSTKIIIADDIADSFDYKNKYAIVEYLYEISKHKDFYLILLTHNYDFYRTFFSKLDINREFVLIANKTENEISLDIFKYQNKNPLKVWISNLRSSKLHFLACIPLVRNIIEIKNYQNDNANYDLLSDFLHNRKKGITTNEIYEIFVKELNLTKKNLSTDLMNKDLENILKEVVEEINEKYNKRTPKFYDDLEHKIVLSIYLRREVEKIIYSLLPPENSNNKEKLTLGKLIEKFFKLKKLEENEVDILIKKILTTSLILLNDYIHINSFMFEPLIDTDIFELIKLYEDINKYKSLVHKI